jgi:hypothetical protein
MFIVCLQTKCLTPNSSGPLIITSKLKGKLNFSVMFLFYSLQKKNYISKSYIYFEDLLRTSFEDAILSGAIVASGS